MIDLEGAHLDLVLIEDHAFLDFVRNQLCAFGRIASAADAQVDGESLRQMFHHLPGSLRTPNIERRAPFAPRPADPTRQPKIGKPDHVIGMMVR
jgi:hypothetical protein